jgi:hypothetical protein
MKVNRQSARLDFFGFWASALCALHCALMPVVLGISALGGLAFLASPWAEGLMLGSSGLLAATSLLPSWRKHRQWLPLALAAAGFAFLLGGHELGHHWIGGRWIEAGASVVGGLLVASSHWQNQRLSKSCPIPAFRQAVCTEAH